MEQNTPKPRLDHYITKSHLHIREAWEIGKNDPDAVAIMKDAKPIIPKEHRKNAPVLELLKWKRKQGK